MSGASEPDVAPRRAGFIRNPQDFYGGLALVLIALFAWWAGGDLPGMRGIAFGPGTAPRLFALMLGLLGAAVMVTGFLWDGPDVEAESNRGIVASVALILLFFVAVNLFAKFPPAAKLSFPLASVVAAVCAVGIACYVGRGPVLITAAVLFFAGCIRDFGLVITSYVTLMLAAGATREVNWLQSIIWAAALTTFCAFLFPKALNLPLTLWPRF
jgi:hypothetical protein